ncbi:MAG: hypothetical protein IPK85_26005 [Gemmatimonadetes bacterium]|nr:hypothetical protein [Gemmatimonadota bacterium]
MTDDDTLEQQLRPAFDGLRRADAQATPSFEAMMARARVPANAHGDVPVAGARRRVWRWAAIAAPLAAAAGVALWLGPDRAGDREFERAVTEWSRTERALPTDGLLSVPGSEYLRRLPALGTGAVERRRPS